MTSRLLPRLFMAAPGLALAEAPPPVDQAEIIAFLENLVIDKTDANEEGA